MKSYQRQEWFDRADITKIRKVTQEHTLWLHVKLYQLNI